VAFPEMKRCVLVLLDGPGAILLVIACHSPINAMACSGTLSYSIACTAVRRMQCFCMIISLKV
jgi:hypothetical protein